MFNDLIKKSINILDIYWDPTIWDPSYFICMTLFMF